jgi:hypothetical protein
VALFYAHTRNGAVSPTPWYPQALAPALACLCALGCARLRGGRWLAGALSLAAAYLAGATYLLKLIPMYGGYGGGPARPAALLAWYTGDAARWQAILADTIPGSPAVVVPLAAGVAISAAALGVAVARRAFRT